MTDYIIDPSAAVKHLIEEDLTTNVDRLFDQLGEGISLYIPEFFLVECTNVMWSHVRFNGLLEADAKALLEDFVSLTFTVIPLDDVVVRALQIGLKQHLTIYDSVYIALAEKHALPLITADVRQAAAAEQVGITLKPITDF